MAYPLINAMLGSGLTLRFSVKGHRYEISPTWDMERLDDPWVSAVTGYCFSDIDENTHTYGKLSGWKRLLDIPLEGGLTLRNDYAEVVFESLYPSEKED